MSVKTASDLFVETTSEETLFCKRRRILHFDLEIRHYTLGLSIYIHNDTVFVTHIQEQNGYGRLSN